MKKTYLLLLCVLLITFSCKKTEVDATSIKTFQSSVNDLESSLNTVQQIKFNEALYILKTFAVEGNDDLSDLKALSKLLDGKKVPEIFDMANKVAAENSVEWTSTGPPSLGTMNIFATVDASERDPNDIQASSLSISTTLLDVDSIVGAKAIRITPRLVDNSGKPITFDGAALETIMEVSSNGTRLSTAKNLMQNNNFKGFTLKFASLPLQKIINDKIEVKIIVKSSKKTYQMIKTGIAVNTNALQIPAPEIVEQPVDTFENPENIDPNNPTSTPTNPTTAPTTAENPKAIVYKFLNNLGGQNLKGAYETSENANWGSFDNFSNPTSGFGAVKNLSVNSVTTKNTTDNSASVNANYNVTDKTGNVVALDVTYGLKNVNGTWKINNYKINSSTKK